MIPESNREDVVQNGISFMRAITEAYGSEEGLKLWDTIATTLDPDLKGQIFFAMLTGNAPGRIRIVRIDPGCVNNKVGQIKAVRAASGWSLKEAKDAVDELGALGRHIIIECAPELRASHIAQLRQSGLHC